MGGKLEEPVGGAAAAATASAGGDVAALLASDQFRPFLADSFDPASFASRSLAEGGGTTAQAQTEALQAGVAALDGALRGLVLRHQGELLAQAGRLADGEAAVQRIALSVRSLQMVAARVRAEVTEPYQQIAARTQQLANLQATVDLLRHTIHRLKLVQRLRQQMGAAEGAGAWSAGGGSASGRGLAGMLWELVAALVASLFRSARPCIPSHLHAPMSCRHPGGGQGRQAAGPLPCPTALRCMPPPNPRRHPGGGQGRQAAVRGRCAGRRGRPIGRGGGRGRRRVSGHRRRRRAQPDRGGCWVLGAWAGVAGWRWWLEMGAEFLATAAAIVRSQT